MISHIMIISLSRTLYNSRDHVLASYFNELAYGIVIIAETVAVERLLMRTQEELSVNTATLLNQQAFVKSNTSDIQRDVSTGKTVIEISSNPKNLFSESMQSSSLIFIVHSLVGI